MISARLDRFAHFHNGVLGHFWIGGLYFVSLEDPWKGNEAFTSCIPPGDYLVRRAVTPRHGQTWMIQAVPNRTAILIHAGNNTYDTEGCILLGRWWGVTANGPYITESKASIAKLNEAMAGEQQFSLRVSLYNPYK